MIPAPHQAATMRLYGERKQQIFFSYMPLHRIFYNTLSVLKWPVALLSFAFLPSMVWALWQEILGDLSALTFVFFGALAYAALWWFSIRNWTISWLSTLEHELTHCLFAWLTGNKVGEIKVTFRRGGHMVVIGSPNWLIDVAPYFFPTVTVVLLLLAPLVPALDVVVYQLAIGISLCYHITSSMTETHEGQTDLQKAGFLFCWMFLPTANLAALGLTLAGANAGWPGISHWFNLLRESPWNTVVFKFIGM